MSRKTNEKLYVPLTRNENAAPKEDICEKRGLPPVKNILICAAISLGATLAVILILMFSGLRLTTFERHDGTTVKYFGWMQGNTPTFGIMKVSDGTGASVGGGRIMYSDGSVYTGEMDGLAKNGWGTLILANGTKYEGWFKNDVFDTGDGTKGSSVTYFDGSKYTGQFKDGKYHGYGILTEANGTTYSGSFENGDPYGSGKAVYFDGSSFEGTFKNGMRYEGIYRWPNGVSISGKFNNNVPDALDYLLYTDGEGNKYSVQIVGGIIVQKESVREDSST